jgi:hypothetical protein
VCAALAAWCVQFACASGAEPPLEAVRATSGVVLDEVFQYVVGKSHVWIPPDCQQVRGVIIGGQTLIEMDFVRDPLIRAAAAKADMAIILRLGAGGVSGTVSEVAAAIGIPEIEYVPWITFGHSTGGIFCRNVAYSNPNRTAGVIHIKSGNFQEKPSPDASLNGVPLLAINGQLEEFGPDRALDESYRPKYGRETQWVVAREQLVEMRAQGQLVSLLVDPGAGHYAWSRPLSEYAALFISKVAQYRLPKEPPKDHPLECIKIKQESGWLTDSEIKTPSNAPAAYADYKGDKTRAFWHFDEELARAHAAFHQGRLSLTDQMVTFTQNGSPIPFKARPGLPVTLVDDGLTLKFTADFFGEYPAGTLNAGKPLGHADGPILFKATGSPLAQIGPDTFRFLRNAFFPYGGTMTCHVTAFHRGDGKFRYAEQTAVAKLQIRHSGQAQKIDFAPIPDQGPSAAPIQLGARSDSGLPVSYYVACGPAKVDGDVLRIVDVPQRGKFPIKVTVVAYQLGRAAGQTVQEALPVEQSFQAAKR